MYTILERKVDGNMLVFFIRTAVYNNYLKNTKFEDIPHRITCLSDVVMDKVSGELKKVRDPDKIFHAICTEYNIEVAPILYRSEDEIVEDMWVQMNEEDKQSLREYTEKELIRLHSNVGMYIRNTYHIWDENNPNINFGESGTHPDDISFNVITKLWKRSQE